MSKINVVALLLVVISVTTLADCAVTQVDLSSENNSSPSKFVPYVADYGIDIFVDKVDGEPTKFGERDSVLIDPGTHELVVRLEYQPAAGSAIVVGGIANLLLRAGTNKTFETAISVDVKANTVYRVIAKSTSEDQIDLIVFNETLDKEVLTHSFILKDGRFERLY